MEAHKCENSDFPFMNAEIVRDCLYWLSVHKSMEPDGVLPSILKKLVYDMEGPLLIIYQRSGKVPADWKLVNVLPVYKKDMREDLGNEKLLV